jgi:hypothetical protein
MSPPAKPRGSDAPKNSTLSRPKSLHNDTISIATLRLKSIQTGWHLTEDVTLPTMEIVGDTILILRLLAESRPSRNKLLRPLYTRPGVLQPSTWTYPPGSVAATRAGDPCGHHWLALQSL